MQTFTCACGQRLYFENSRCLNCDREVGWCPGCRTITAVEAGPAPGQHRCMQAGCGQVLRKCFNYETHGACNRFVAAGSESTGMGAPLCDMCRFNDVIPDLSIAGNLANWTRLETAKRRVLWQLQMLGLPPFRTSPTGPPLRFDFKADAVQTDAGWRPLGQEKVYTGHAQGRITINIREADPVEREKLRVSFGESHRTLVGHFRHELAHYLYDACIGDTPHASAFEQTFGSPVAVSYGQAMQRHYQQGPPAGWPGQYVSAYATMHPLEDWAETAAVLLEAHAVVDTAYHHGRVDREPAGLDFDALLGRFVELGVFLNEINRGMGLLDVVPRVFTPAVRSKLAFAHRVLMG